MTTKHTQRASGTSFSCTCGVLGDQNEMDAHLATVTREEADAMLADVWTLVCSAAEDRDYTVGELEKIVASCTEVATKLKTLLGQAIWEPTRPNKVDKHRVDHSDYVRVSGDVTCKVCGYVYYDHPAVVGFEWLRRACDGRLLKL